ncbi:Fic family protein [Micromonospora zamorensis]|uniref:Fic family protein n=1 Tax=Micromonospora zamorensis TaxID=709883 RepID=UPI003D950C33
MVALLLRRRACSGKTPTPTLWTKAAALLHSLVNNHPFVDGNNLNGTRTRPRAVAPGIGPSAAGPPDHPFSTCRAAPEMGQQARVARVHPSGQGGSQPSRAQRACAVP